MNFPIEAARALIEYYYIKSNACNSFAEGGNIAKIMDMLVKVYNGERWEELSIERSRDYDPRTYIEIWHNRNGTALGIMLKRPREDDDLDNLFETLDKSLPTGHFTKLHDRIEDKELNQYVYHLEVRIPNRDYHDSWKDAIWFDDDHYEYKRGKGKWSDEDKES